MRVTGTGHAGLLIETETQQILMDPWMSPEGAFFASWFPYPDNAHLMESPALRAPTALVVTKDRPDFADPWLLAQIPAHIPAILPRYPSPSLRRTILAARPRPLIELAPWETHRFEDGAALFFVSEESPMNHASAVALTSAGTSLLNVNDARVSLAQLRSMRSKVGGAVDLLALQGASPSWLPLVCDMRPELRRELAQKRRLSKLLQMARMIRTVEPRLAVPSAGPPCFLDDELAPLNAEMLGNGMLPDPLAIAAWLRDKHLPNITTLLPGDAIDLASLEKETDPRSRSFADEDREAYLRAYARRREPHRKAVWDRHPEPSRPLADDLRAHLADLLAMSPHFNRKINMRVGFAIEGPGGGAVGVDFREGHEGTFDDIAHCDCIFSVRGRWIAAILERRASFSDLLLSLRLCASGAPELYNNNNEHLAALLKFADRAALDAVEDYERAMELAPFITVHTEGRTFLVQRSCPHAGQDLTEVGETAPGNVIVCLTHHYEFDLETGRCITNDRCPNIKVTEK